MAPNAPARIAVIGMTLGETSGMRDYADLQAARLGGPCSFHWLVREKRSRAEIASWREQVAGELSRERPDVLLLHYSAFAYSHRGVPMFLPGVLRTLRAAGAPLVTVLHELAYPWHRPGARERVWAVTQRMALVDLFRAASAAVATTEHNAAWARSRRWLPRRPISVAPVFSNLPLPSVPAPAVVPGRVGLFGYGNEEALMEPVLDAVARVRDDRDEVRLLLLGAPGGDSERGRELVRDARACGVSPEAIAFSGVLPAQELSDLLASCEVLLSCASPGPTSRKGTIAASLSSGRPLLALDGRQTWRELADAEAVLLARPDGASLASGLERLLGDAELQARLGARGSEFARDRLSVEHGARVLEEIFASLRH
jgi:glycosyltransferase involved in cell wall biosynthesis